ncbi:MAG TPA: Gfo/Idh/MocA family oxidoreductase [Planctomycetota bacterium]|jgi:predicted dehydrogenase|nr:Gfo/Idh/MocA family oxidoreductase [Planctomycetota bacterium]
MSKSLSRRRFLELSGAGVSALALSGCGTHVKPQRTKLAHAVVGCGGMGGSDMNSIASHPGVEIVALCDVDLKNLEAAAKKFPSAKTYRDFRKMFAEMSDDIDTVNVGTPDHMHAAISMTAMNNGIHVYCQKPLTHDVYESRRLAEVARERKLVTQMGIQVHSSKEYRLAVRLIQDGAIGKVKEVHSWSSKKWGHDGPRPEGEDPVPPNLDWDLWIGTAPMRPYKKSQYHSMNWRKWTDFGCGTMGDMSIHILDPIAGALALTQPKTILSESDAPPPDSFATKNIVKYTFPGTKFTVDPFSLTWYDGDAMPSIKGWPVEKLPDQGSMFVGEKGFMLLPHVAKPQLLPVETFKDYTVPDVKGDNHWHQFVNACKGEGTTSANFDYAGPLTEFVLLGVLANRVPGKLLTWDAAALKLQGSPEASALLRRKYRKGWEVDGL